MDDACVMMFFALSMLLCSTGMAHPAGKQSKTNMELYNVFVEAPENVAAVKSDTEYITLPCKTVYTTADYPDILSRIRWFATTYHDDTGPKTRTYTDHGYLKPFAKDLGYQLHKSDPSERFNFDLKVPLKSMDYAGNYSCSLFTDSGSLSYGAQLIILESTPVCNSNISDPVYVSQKLTFSCEVVHKNYHHAKVWWFTIFGNWLYDSVTTVAWERTSTSVSVTVDAGLDGEQYYVRIGVARPQHDVVENDLDGQFQWATNAPAFYIEHFFPKFHVSPASEQPQIKGKLEEIFVEAPGPRIFETEAPGPRIVETEAPGPRIFETEAPGPRIFETEAPGPRIFETEAHGPRIVETEAPGPRIFETETPEAAKSPHQAESPSRRAGKFAGSASRSHDPASTVDQWMSRDQMIVAVCVVFVMLAAAMVAIVLVIRTKKKPFDEEPYMNRMEQQTAIDVN